MLVFTQQVPEGPAAWRELYPQHCQEADQSLRGMWKKEAFWTASWYQAELMGAPGWQQLLRKVLLTGGALKHPEQP